VVNPATNQPRWINLDGSGFVTYVFDVNDQRAWWYGSHMLSSVGTPNDAALFEGAEYHNGEQIGAVLSSGASPFWGERKYEDEDSEENEGQRTDCAECNRILAAGAAGNLYIQLSTALYPQGALRAQLTRVASTGNDDGYRAVLTGLGITPNGITTENSGSAKFVFDGEKGELEARIDVDIEDSDAEDGSNSITAVKLQRGDMVLYDFPREDAEDDLTSISLTLPTNYFVSHVLDARETKVVVYTSKHPNGELTGVVHP
jgi:hypothetical protein